MYFQKFNNFIYDFDIDGNGERTLTLVADITKNVRLRNEILSNITLYDEYDMRYGDTPEIIAEKVYGSAEYHWVVMLCNLRYDWINDYPMAQPELDRYVTQKYGSGNEYATHHYIDSNGFEVDSDNAEATSVSNYSYEDSQNESKRRIKLISSKFLQNILKSFEEIM